MHATVARATLRSGGGDDTLLEHSMQTVLAQLVWAATEISGVKLLCETLCF